MKTYGQQKICQIYGKACATKASQSWLMILTKPNKRKKLNLLKIFQLNSRINVPLFLNQKLYFFLETENSPESLFLRKCLSTPETPSAQPPTAERTVKHPGDKCTHYLDLFQNLLRVMEEIKWFTKSTERKFEELEMTL